MIKCSARFEQVRRTMKTIRFLLLVFAVVGGFAVATDAQTKKKPVKTTPAANKSSTLPPLDVRAARSKVDVQLTNVSLFVKNFGPVAQAIEALDAEAKTN